MDRLEIDTLQWRRDYCRAMIEVKKGNQQAYGKIRRLRAQVFEETVAIAKRGWYITGPSAMSGHDAATTKDAGQDRRVNSGEGVRHELAFDEPMIARTKFYDREFSVVDIPAKYENTIVDVDNIDCLKAARQLIDEGYRPAVLNMASRRNPGGGVVTGAGAQEESLFRRTNLFRSLYQFAPYAEQYTTRRSPHQYPLDCNFGGIYTPGVTVFRDTERLGYALLEEPYQVAVISVPGLNRPDLTPDGQIADHHVEPVRHKIRTILRIALDNGHDAIVLGALGCGAFRNPPAHVARLFREVMLEDEFRGKFRCLFFAILEDHNSRQPHNPEGNFQPFYRELHDLIPEERLMQRAMTLWTMGAGNSARRFNLEDPMPKKDRVATKDSWHVKPMPREHVVIPMDVVIPARAMEVVRMGHIPDGMEDHWFMYCDDRTIRYYRSWTGICIHVARYRIDGEFCEIYELTANRHPKQYLETDEEADVSLFMSLLMDEF